MDTDDLPRAWWHGCWLRPGHYLFDRNGRSDSGMEPCPLGRGVFEVGWLDGSLAPRRVRAGARPPLEPLSGGVVYRRMGRNVATLRQSLERCSDEAPQGEFLLHAIGGCTIAAWWDRTQGDERGACNSCLILENPPGSGWCAKDLLALFPRLFPVQAARLASAGVQLKFLRWA